MATTCMARIVVNQANVDDHFHNLINKPKDFFYCANGTINITGCIDNEDCAGIANYINACFYINAGHNYCVNATVRICLDDTLCANGTIYACTDLHGSNAIVACNAAAVGACNDAGTRIAASNNGATVDVGIAACNAAIVGVCATADRKARAHRANDGSGK